MKVKLLKKASSSISMISRGKGSTTEYIAYYTGSDDCHHVEYFNKKEEMLEFRRKLILNRARYLAYHSVMYSVNERIKNL